MQEQGLELELYKNSADFPGGRGWRICWWSVNGDVNKDKVNMIRTQEAQTVSKKGSVSSSSVVKWLAEEAALGGA